MNEITQCPECEFEWTTNYGYVIGHYCSAIAPLDDGEESWTDGYDIEDE